jgi:hypothetical protein
MTDVEPLLELAKEKWKGQISPSEEKLFRATANGEIADYATGDLNVDDPASAGEWTPDRVLRASRIAWLCTDKKASQFVTHHGIQIKGARIDEKFDLQHADISFPLALLEGACPMGILFQHAHILTLNLGGMQVGQIDADGLNVRGDLFLRFLRYHFQAKGEICLRGATIGGNLFCKAGRFANSEDDAISRHGTALDGQCLKVGRNISLHASEVHGEVCLFGATIGGTLDCEKGQFINPNGTAINADGIKVGGSVWLRHGFKAEGEVRLHGARIEGDLDCRHGTFIDDQGEGIFANGIEVQGDLFLCDQMKADCRISLVSARISGLLHCTGLVSTEHVWLDLRHANIHALRDEKESWPKNGRLFLHGLLYDEIHNKAPRDANARIDWIRRQCDLRRSADFWTQPYEQLAKVLRESGDDTGAKDVLIAKNKDKAERTKLTRAQWLWYHLLGRLIGYGYKPWRAVPIAIGIILLGWIFFATGYSGGLITPPGDSAYTTTEKFPVPDPCDGTRGISTSYPVFNSLVYSIDVFVPVVDFHQANYWLPNANRGDRVVKIGPWPLHTGGLLLFWLWAETVFGWVLSTLFVVGITGLVRT